MSAEPRPEVWLRGALPGIPPPLMPAAHCLLQCREEIGIAAASLTFEQLWARPGGAASAGYHLRHIVGSLDRLLTYARGAQLDRAQMVALRAEGAAVADTETALVLVETAQTAGGSVAAHARIYDDEGESGSVDLLLEQRGVGLRGIESVAGGDAVTEDDDPAARVRCSV